MSKSREFSDIQLRMNEKRPLNTLNRDKNRITIRLDTFLGLAVVCILTCVKSFFYHFNLTLDWRGIMMEVGTSHSKIDPHVFSRFPLEGKIKTSVMKVNWWVYSFSVVPVKK